RVGGPSLALSDQEFQAKARQVEVASAGAYGASVYAVHQAHGGASFGAGGRQFAHEGAAARFQCLGEQAQQDAGVGLVQDSVVGAVLDQLCGGPAFGGPALGLAFSQGRLRTWVAADRLGHAGGGCAVAAEQGYRQFHPGGVPPGGGGWDLFVVLVSHTEVAGRAGVEGRAHQGVCGTVVGGVEDPGGQVSELGGAVDAAAL